MIRRLGEANMEQIDRRTLLRSIAAVTVAGTTSNHALSETPRRDTKGDDGPTVIAHLDTGLVRVAQGQVTGYQRKGIFTYKGIPYASATSGAKRFQPPSPAEPWTGVRSSRSWGPICPQLARSDGRHNDQETFMFDWFDATARVYAAGEGEDCLRLNIWTPGINDGKKRPVMVWIHSGGYTNGSGHEQWSYDGENLARRGDAVIVSVNHRLNALGFLDLSAYGYQFKQSANIGLLDLVAALEWVRDNIAVFGGDSGCVTIFGQSGGGSKVCALMAMPAAKGLFHRAISESGSLLRAMPQAKSRALAAEIVQELKLDAGSIDQLQSMPYERLLSATDAVMKRQSAKPADQRLSFGAVLDGVVIAENPFDGIATSISADVPIIVGSTLNEFTNATNNPELAQMTEAELEKRVRAAHPQRADVILETYRRTIPAATPWQRWWQIASVPVREGAISQCKAKAALGKAPAYLYWFVWQTPILDQTPGAFHCSEISFVFDNTDRCEYMTGGGPRPRALAAVMSEAWLHFARTGNPNHPGMPQWKPFSTALGEVMIFDDVTKLALDPDGSQRNSVTWNQSSR